MSPDDPPGHLRCGRAPTVSAPVEPGSLTHAKRQRLGSARPVDVAACRRRRLEVLIPDAPLGASGYSGGAGDGAVHWACRCPVLIRPRWSLLLTAPLVPGRLHEAKGRPGLLTRNLWLLGPCLLTRSLPSALIFPSRNSKTPPLSNVRLYVTPAGRGEAPMSHGRGCSSLASAPAMGERCRACPGGGL